MKNFLMAGTLALLFFTSCKTAQLATYKDDVYADPKEELLLAQQAKAAKAKADSIEHKRQADEYAAGKIKEEPDPYYKEPEYNSDDYYDYQYASRLNRFYSPLSGAGYYDNYYTNCYTYDSNPLMYGTSIYSTYNYWTPSVQFGYYSNGFGLGLGSCNYSNSYASGCGSYWGYNYYGYNPGNCFYNPYYNWGYYNSYDVNSAYGSVNSGPRGSNGGGNGSNRTNAGMEIAGENSERQKHIRSVNEQQKQSPRFVEEPQRMNRNTNSSISENPVNTSQQSTAANSQQAGTANTPGNSQPSSPRMTRQNRQSQTNDPWWTGIFTTESSGSQRMSRHDSSPQQSNPNSSGSNSGWNSRSDNSSSSSGNSGSQSGGNSGRSGGDQGSSPRSSGGGGNSRHR